MSTATAMAAQTERSVLKRSPKVGQMSLFDALERAGDAPRAHHHSTPSDADVRLKAWEQLVDRTHRRGLEH